jgi:hypothetical protein
LPHPTCRSMGATDSGVLVWRPAIASPGPAAAARRSTEWRLVLLAAASGGSCAWSCLAQSGPRRRRWFVGAELRLVHRRRLYRPRSLAGSQMQGRGTTWAPGRCYRVTPPTRTHGCRSSVARRSSLSRSHERPRHRPQCSYARERVSPGERVHPLAAPRRAVGLGHERMVGERLPAGSPRRCGRRRDRECAAGRIIER